MPLNSKIKVVSVKPYAQFSGGGGSTEAQRVEFMVGEQGPFFRDFPMAKFTPEGIAEELNPFADTLAAIGAPGA